MSKKSLFKLVTIITSATSLLTYFLFINGFGSTFYDLDTFLEILFTYVVILMAFGLIPYLNSQFTKIERVGSKIFNRVVGYLFILIVIYIITSGLSVFDYVRNYVLFSILWGIALCVMLYLSLKRDGKWTFYYGSEYLGAYVVIILIVTIVSGNSLRIFDIYHILHFEIFGIGFIIMLLISLSPVFLNLFHHNIFRMKSGKPIVVNEGSEAKTNKETSKPKQKQVKKQLTTQSKRLAKDNDLDLF